MVFADPPVIDTGNTAWLLVSSALVLIMTPGVAFFYGGLNRSKSVLNMMMMSFSCMGLVSVLWLLYGFSISFGTNSNSTTNNFLGSFTQYLGTKTFLSEVWGVTDAAPNGTGIPTYVVLAFQMMFAIITVALISGAISDRAKFAGWLLFAFGWFTIVYVPVAHWIWGGGFIFTKIHALDFAGGSAVHINAGSAALALALVLGKRVGWPGGSFKPHNVPFVALGAALLQDLQHLGQQAFVVLQVPVHDGDEGRGAGHGALDHRAGQAASAHPVQALDPRVLDGDGLDLGRGAVGRVVVDEDDFPDDVGQHRLQLGDQLGDIGPLVEGGDHHRQLQARVRLGRRGAGRRARCSGISHVKVPLRG